MDLVGVESLAAHPRDAAPFEEDRTLLPDLSIRDDTPLDPQDLHVTSTSSLHGAVAEPRTPVMSWTKLLASRLIIFCAVRGRRSLRVQIYAVSVRLVGVPRISSDKNS